MTTHKEEETAKCSVCKRLFQREVNNPEGKLVSCPAHSFGEVEEVPMTHKKEGEKIKLLRKEFYGGLKQKEEVIEVAQEEVERLLTTDSLDIFYTTL